MTEDEEEIKAGIEEFSENNFGSWALVKVESGRLTLRNKHNHGFCIFNDDKVADVIINSLVQLGIEIYPDWDAFGKKYPRQPCIQ